MNILKNVISSTNIGITSKGKELVQNLLAWQLLPSDAPAQPCMIYGAIHLARLIGNFKKTKYKF